MKCWSTYPHVEVLWRQPGVLTTPHTHTVCLNISWDERFGDSQNVPVMGQQDDKCECIWCESYPCTLTETLVTWDLQCGQSVANSPHFASPSCPHTCRLYYHTDVVDSSLPSHACLPSHGMEGRADSDDHYIDIQSFPQWHVQSESRWWWVIPNFFAPLDIFKVSYTWEVTSMLGVTRWERGWSMVIAESTTEGPTGCFHGNGHVLHCKLAPD